MKMALISEEQIKKIEDALGHSIISSGGETGCDHEYGVCFCKEKEALAIIQSLNPRKPVARFVVFKESGHDEYHQVAKRYNADPDVVPLYSKEMK